MELKLNLPKPKLHNHFDFVITDTKTKKVDKVHVENIVLNQCYDSLLGRMARRTGKYINIGDGSGVVSPDRTTLFNQFTSPAVEDFAAVITPDLTVLSGKVTLSESSHVGKSISEVGFSIQDLAYVVRLFTHALLQDAEGNPIVIPPKTNTQIIEIYLTIYLERVSGMRPFPNALSTFFTSLSNGTVMLNSMKVHPQNVDLGLTGAYVTATKTFTSDVKSLAAAAGNYVGLWNMDSVSHPVTDIINIDIDPFEKIPFPNAAIFPTFTFSERTIGVGDGTKRFFNLASGYFIEGSETIKVDGVVKTKDVDYITHQGARQPLNVPDALPYNANIVPDLYTTDSSKGSRVFTTEAIAGNTLGASLYHLIDLKTPMYVADMWMYLYDATVELQASLDDVTWVPVYPATAQYYTKTAAPFNPPMMTRYIWIKANRNMSGRPMPIIFGQPNIEFINPVAGDAVVTATWSTEIPPKNANLFYNIQAAITGQW